jgi:homoserine kinase
MRAIASAPASTANLGAGFDVVGLALSLRCRIEVFPALDWEVESAGEDGGTVEMLRQVAESAVGGAGPFRVSVESEIPVTSGLGSSAALIVVAAAAMRIACGLPAGREEVFAAAAAVEGHGDNAGASVYGGAIAVSPSGVVRPLAVHESLRVLVAVPDAILPTAEARKALEAPISTAAAARTASRLAFLIEGLRTGDPVLLAEAGGDEIHESRRAHLSPLTGDLVEAARAAGALHSAWSGAGPSAVALVTAASAGPVLEAWGRMLEGRGRALGLAVDTEGLIVG